jgi:hypothetical protein
MNKHEIFYIKNLESLTGCFLYFTGISYDPLILDQGIQWEHYIIYPDGEKQKSEVNAKRIRELLINGNIRKANKLEKVKVLLLV